MDMELNSEEAKIEKRLYKAFGGRMALNTGQRARFSSWIAAFKRPGSRAIGRAAFLAMWLSKCILATTLLSSSNPSCFALP